MAIIEINKKVTLARLHVALVLHENEGDLSETAEKLGGVTEEMIKTNIRALTEGLKSGVLFKQDEHRAYIATERGEEVLAAARDLLVRAGALGRIGSPTCRVAFLPQHAHLIAQALQGLADADVDVELEVLAEHHRSRASFERNVIVPLAHGALDLVVGLPPVGLDSLVDKEALYISQLEAMVAKDRADTGATIDLPTLVLDYELLLPPPRTRSRILLDGEMEEHVDAALLEEKRIVVEAYGTKVLVDFARTFHGAIGSAPVRRHGGAPRDQAVVVPSDIAYPFKQGNAFGGEGSEKFEWIPVCVDGEPLTHQVVVNRQRASRPQAHIDTVVAALHAAARVEQLNVDEPGHRCKVTNSLLKAKVQRDKQRRTDRQTVLALS